MGEGERRRGERERERDKDTYEASGQATEECVGKCVSERERERVRLSCLHLKVREDVATNTVS